MRFTLGVIYDLYLDEYLKNMLENLNFRAFFVI